MSGRDRQKEIMNLYLVRHAEALPIGGDVRRDADRPLSAQGERDAVLLGRAFRILDPSVRRIASSPLLRASQTADILAAQFSAPPAVHPWPALEPGITLRDVHTEICAQEDASLIVVAHQPDLTDYLTWVIAGAPVDIAFPPGTAACVTLAAYSSPGSAQLRWIASPAFLSKLHSAW
jgi:phosphohistidine phosphatase